MERFSWSWWRYIGRWWLWTRLGGFHALPHACQLCSVVSWLIHRFRCLEAAQLISQISEYSNTIGRTFFNLLLDVREGCRFERFGLILEILALVDTIANVVLEVLQPILNCFCKMISQATLVQYQRSLTVLDQSLGERLAACLEVLLIDIPNGLRTPFQ